ncbi:MAG: hypothetical protein ACE5KH_05540, partial [Candidatus Geothermarchaeales archaeon]
PGVSVLGPVEDKTGIEMSCSDAYRLGLTLEDPENKRFSPGVTLIGPKGSVFVTIEYPVTGRWIFASKTKAQENGLAKGMRVNARVGGSSEWAATFHQVYVSVPEDDQEGWALYLDTDEANAASAQTGDMAYLLLERD